MFKDRLSIKENTQKVKGYLLEIKYNLKNHYGGLFNYEREIFYGLFLVLVAFLSFGLGRLTKIEESRLPVKIENIQLSSTDEKKLNDIEIKNLSSSLETKIPVNYQTGAVIVSKNGKRYHFPWCASAKTIKEENKVIYNSEQEALSAGYTLAGNCKRLEQ